MVLAEQGARGVGLRVREHGRPVFLQAQV
jgi:hypothetical protein